MTRSFPSPIMEAVDSVKSSVPRPWSRVSASHGPRSSCSDELHNLKDPHEHYHPRHTRPHTDDDLGGSGGVESPISPLRTPERRRKSMTSIHDTARHVMSLEARLALLESQLSSREGVKSLAPLPSKSEALDGPIEGPSILSDDPKDLLKQQTIVPDLVERSWSDFMNKDIHRTNEFAIEILLNEPPQEDSTSVEMEAIVDGDANGSHIPPRRHGISCRLDDSCSLAEVPNRIRINSQVMLKILRDIDSSVDDTAAPLLMLRPYKLIVRHEEQIRKELLRASFNSKEKAQAEEAAEDRAIRSKHLQCLIDFFDRYIKPTIDYLQDASTTAVRYRDLWYLFRPGEDIYMPLKTASNAVAKLPDTIEANPEVFRGRYNMLWRVTGTGGGRPSLHAYQDRLRPSKCNDFSVNCYYIDFDGKYFLPTNHTFPIYPFEGERDITSLDFFPVRFLRDGRDRLHEFTTRGEAVFDAISRGCRPFYYSGPTVVSQPCGCPMQEQPLHQRYIESEVIVDFKNTLFNHPEWRPKAGFWKPPVIQRNEIDEKRPIRYLERSKNQKLAKMKHMEYDYIYDDHVVDLDLAYDFKDKEPIFTQIPSSWAFNAEMVPEKDVNLLSGRVFAFSLRTRSFVALWLWRLTPITEQKASLNNLQLRDNSRKHTIAKLVSAHFRQSERQTSEQEYDVVRGKGKGLVFLLHGAPGVGKTSTAESIAAASGRPLFSITCGDLGLTPKEVEEALEEIFRFAQMWNCILLLDECDIFLARRNKTDVVRNGLVSVFLRTLEFYTGVLFLTTNRVGVIDDAIKSRLTWIAYYPPLDASQTKRIWEVNLRLLRERNIGLEIDDADIMQFARDHFVRSRRENCCWNGRQIQNAFKVATALAEWDAHESHTTATSKTDLDEQAQVDSVSCRPLLNASHFETIAQGSQAFDYYLKEATGRSEAERAFQNVERADDWSFEEELYDSQHSGMLPEFRYGSKSATLNQESWNEACQAPSLVPPNSHHTGSYQRRDSQGYKGRRRSSTTQRHRPQISSSMSNNVPRKSAIALLQSEKSGRSSSIDFSTASPRQKEFWPDEESHGQSRGHRYEDGSSASDFEDSQYRRKERGIARDYWPQDHTGR